MSQKTPHTLYLCYFGLREPLVQTQVLPYLREIHKGGTKVSILTFEANPKENWTNQQIESERSKLAGEGINWDFLTYHKRPSVPATIFDVFNGARYARRKVRKYKIDVLHARSHVPAMMGALAKTFSFGVKPKLLFDIRGFFPEEYTDAGNWQKDGWIYRSVKKAEKWLMKTSDAFVVLTEKAQEILFPESKENGFDKKGRPVEVIPCCVNLKRFEAANEKSRFEMRAELKLENRFVIVYVGSLGTWYLAEEMADFIQTAREGNSSVFALILTQSAPQIMRNMLLIRGFTENDFLVKKIPPAEIPRYLSASDLALSFIKPCYSKLSSSPTKIAEYLASGTPVVVNSGVGDIEKQVENDKVGVVIDRFNRRAYAAALERTNKKSKEDWMRKCRISAAARFDLEGVGGKSYRRLYRKLLNKN